jgi:triphosphoribosyl-dephospho-CoA synthase
MTRALNRGEIETAYRAACRLEVRTLKPGNVHIFAGGHRMTVEDFDLSTEVSAPHIADDTLSVGTRIRRAVEATFAAVGQNTNLGILLLCAPLAAAAERHSSATLADKLTSVLAGLDHEDAREVYSAIATANPAGLGQDNIGDVRAEPPAAWTLLDAMRAAAPRDMIANEYATGFAGIFANARTFAAQLKSGASAEDALAHLFLSQLAERPDTHIIRKHGPGLAQRVQERAAGVLAELNGAPPKSLSTPANRALLITFDAELKSWGANPGSLADLMCASVFTSTLDAAAQNHTDN